MVAEEWQGLAMALNAAQLKIEELQKSNEKLKVLLKRQERALTRIRREQNAQVLMIKEWHQSEMECIDFQLQKQFDLFLAKDRWGSNLKVFPIRLFNMVTGK